MKCNGLFKKLWQKVFPDTYESHPAEQGQAEPDGTGQYGLATATAEADAPATAEADEDLDAHYASEADRDEMPGPEPQDWAAPQPPAEPAEPAPRPAPAEQPPEDRLPARPAQKPEVEVIREGQIVETLNRLSDIPPAVKSAVMEAMREAGENSEQRTEALKVLRDLAESSQERNETLGELLGEVNKHSEQLDGIRTAIVEPTASQTQALEHLRRMREVIEGLGQDSGTQTRAIEDLSESWESTRSELTEQLSGQSKRMTQALAAIIALLGVLVILAGVFAITLIARAT